jgi:hypothetical protein
MFKNHSSSITHKHQASITLYKITWLEKKVTNLDPPHKKKRLFKSKRQKGTSKNPKNSIFKEKKYELYINFGEMNR